MKKRKPKSDWTGVIEKHGAFSPTLPATVAAASNFSRRMIDRYPPQSWIASRADLAFEWAERARANYFREDLHFQISPYINIQRAGDARPGTERPAAQGRGDYLGAKEASVLYERLFENHRRRSTFEAALAAAPVMADLVSPVRVERVLPQRVTAPESEVRKAAVSERSEAPSSGPGAGWGTPFHLSPAPQPITLPQPEMRRVADQVLREIDRRITASRERMGRR